LASGTFSEGGPVHRAPSSAPTARTRVSAAFFRRPWLRAVLLLSGPGAWFVLIYLAALILLFLSALWKVDPLSGKIVHELTFANFERLFKEPVYRTIALRTIGIAAAVTVTDAILAVPFAFFAVRVAPKRLQSVLFVAILIPLWSSYLVRVFAWRLILAKEGILNWFLGQIGLGHINVGYTNWAMWIVFSYIWLPFMILPVWTAVERVPDSLIEASADLGARSWRSFRTVLLPLILPGVVAGSIFTFSLTLGDFITPLLVGGNNSTLIGNVVYSEVGVANNVPFAAAFATIPLVIMGIYLLVARRLGAFEAL
jgi:putative spermidine/putrescine transport system permease protein